MIDVYCTDLTDKQQPVIDLLDVEEGKHKYSLRSIFKDTTSRYHNEACDYIKVRYISRHEALDSTHAR